MGHCTGSKSFSCVMAEATKAKGRELSRLQMFEFTHTHENDGTAVDERFKNVMVMPKERTGRSRGMRCNVTYSQLYGRSKDKNAQNEKKHMAEQNERTQKMVEEKKQMQKELEQEQVVSNKKSK